MTPFWILTPKPVENILSEQTPRAKHMTRAWSLQGICKGWKDTEPGRLEAMGAP